MKSLRILGVVLSAVLMFAGAAYILNQDSFAFATRVSQENTTVPRGASRYLLAFSF